MKRCSCCKALKTLEEFGVEKGHSDGLSSWCKDCMNSKSRERYAENREKYLGSQREYRNRNRDKIRKFAQKSHLALREEVLCAYGNKCQCCGETKYEFLAIDHENGGGNKHRREIGLRNLYRWLKKNGFPKGFRVLCHNCNNAYGFYGRCPHQENIS